MSRIITTAEVKEHNNPQSLWMVIHNEVYDVTEFLHEHPGGEDSLLEFAGKDGTQAFEDVGHSDDARILMKKYKIGKLPPGQQNNPNVNCCPGMPKSDPSGNTWRTFDGSPDRSKAPKSNLKTPTPIKAERRLNAIVVPRERRPRGPPCGRRRPAPPPPPSCSKWKLALLLLSTAIIVGFVVRKYVSK